MERALICVTTLFLVCSSMIPGTAQTNTEKYVVPLPETVLLAVAAQPDCPLQLEQPRLLLGVTPRTQPEFEFKARNIGAKSIVRYTVSFWSSNMTGGTLAAGRSLERALLPGEVLSAFTKDGEIIPLTKETRAELKLNGKMQMIVVLMIDKVVFGDGTTYNAETTSKALGEFFEKE
jgi:hypothetical protein